MSLTNLVVKCFPEREIRRHGDPDEKEIMRQIDSCRSNLDMAKKARKGVSPEGLSQQDHLHLLGYGITQLSNMVDGYSGRFKEYFGNQLKSLRSETHYSRG